MCNQRLSDGRKAKFDAQTQQALHQLASIPAAERMLNALHRIISQKAHKSYDSQRVWLVIRNANPRWSCVDIERHRALLQIPAVHPFEQIWLVGDWHGDSGLLSLFPSNLLAEASAN